MNSKKRGVIAIAVSLAFAWSSSAQTNNPIALGYAHGTAGFVGRNTNDVAGASETVVVFTSATGVRLFALADQKGGYRVPLEPGKYCVSAYDSHGNPLTLSSTQQQCIDVSTGKDVRLDVTISRSVATAETSSNTVELPREIEAQVLSGKIVDAADSPIPEVRVEQLSSDGKVVESVLTNSKGKFVMKPRSPWVYAMRVSKPGFDTLLLKVRVSKNGRRELELTLPVSR